MPRATGVKSLREAEGSSTWLRMWRKGACWPRAEWEWVADASRKAAFNPTLLPPHPNAPLRSPRRCRHNARARAAVLADASAPGEQQKTEWSDRGELAL